MYIATHFGCVSYNTGSVGKFAHNCVVESLLIEYTDFFIVADKFACILPESGVASGLDILCLLLPVLCCFSVAFLLFRHHLLLPLNPSSILHPQGMQPCWQKS